MKTVKNVSRGILSLNLPSRSLHIAPKERVNLEDSEMSATEVRNHVRAKRLKIVEEKTAPKASPKPSPKPASKPKPVSSAGEDKPKESGDKD